MGMRALNALFGVGFLGYGFYLAFLFHGGGYLIFFKAFILPVLMIFRTIRGARASRSHEVPARAGGPMFDQHASAAAVPSESALPGGSSGAPDSHGEQPLRS